MNIAFISLFKKRATNQPRLTTPDAYTHTTFELSVADGAWVREVLRSRNAELLESGAIPFSARFFNPPPSPPPPPPPHKRKKKKENHHGNNHKNNSKQATPLEHTRLSETRGGAGRGNW